MNPTIELTLVDGVKIRVPDSLNLMTTYVLREQQDWFEDEIKFLRQVLEPGQKVVDIGANYGIYTLSMAKCVGLSGQVWAFEPASKTANLLAESIAANHFHQVALEQKALSDEVGTARLSLHDNSELNSLVRGDGEAGVTEAVEIDTLDHCQNNYKWDGIDFLKLDAEGEESNILRGGSEFFSTQSPLVQYEVKAGEDVHLDLVQEFGSLGYSSYRLVPGLGALVPFESGEPVDPFLLNLFACKPDRADWLERNGLLASKPGTRKAICEHRRDDWLEALVALPYGKMCAVFWQEWIRGGQGADMTEALEFYQLSHDDSLRLADRYGALKESFARIREICETDPSFLRLSSLARIARDYGARGVAVRALRQLCDLIFQQRKINTAEPFLAPCERFDSIPPGRALNDWLGAAALEELERNVAFSSFYTGTSARRRLKAISDMGFGNEEMTRRLNLVERRFGFS